VKPAIPAGGACPAIGASHRIRADIGIEGHRKSDVAKSASTHE
jgi:hypothetical protein